MSGPNTLLSETIITLSKQNYTPADVAWVGSYDGEYAISWDEFEKIADIDYDSGYGAQEIAKDLVIVMNDGSWYARVEYDGAESWMHYRVPTKKTNAKLFNRVRVHEAEEIGWCTIDEMNGNNKEGLI